MDVCPPLFFSYFCTLIYFLMTETDFLTHTLPNGIRLIHKPDTSHVGHLGILINTGSRDEEPDEHGLAHFIEHSVFKGTRKAKGFSYP
jgi:predicted Zn-dependent peptidase